MHQVFVRAKDQNGRWGNANALHLTDESFRAFILEMLARNNIVAAIPNEERTQYNLREGMEFEP